MSSLAPRQSALTTLEGTFPRRELSCKVTIRLDKMQQKLQHMRTFLILTECLYFGFSKTFQMSQTAIRSRHISEEARNCDLLILWLDCDRGDLR